MSAAGGGPRESRYSQCPSFLTATALLMPRSFLQLLPSALGVCLVVFALVQQYAAWPLRTVIECRPEAVVRTADLLRYPLPKSMRGEKPGGASFVIHDGRRITGVLRTSGRVTADAEPHLAFTEKAVVWKPPAGAAAEARVTLVLAPDFTLWFWLLLLAGLAPVLHEIMIVRGGAARLRAATARWEQNLALLPPGRQNARLVAGFCITLVLLCAVSDKIRDFGYDGIWYAKIADRGPGVIKDDDGLAMHSMQRIAPMMAVHGVAVIVRSVAALAGADVAPTAADTETGLKHFNSGCLLTAFYITGVAMLTAAMWSGLCVFDRLRLTARRKLAGFIMLAASFPIVRLFAYYPNLSDYYGFALGVFSCHAFLAGRRLVQVALALVGAYTFPMVSVVALGLLAASVEGAAAAHGKGVALRVPGWLRWWVAGAVAVVSAAVIWRMAPLGAEIIAANCTRPLPWLLPVSVGSGAVYLAAAAAGFCAALRTVRLRVLPWLAGGVLALALFLAIQYSTTLVFGRLANGGQTFFWLLQVLSATSVIDPLCFLGAHFAYFGFVVVLGITCWRGMWDEAARHGLSMCLLLALSLVLGMMSESRCLSNAVPFFVFLIAGAVPEWLSPARLLCAQLLACWTWLPLRQGATYFIPFGPWNAHWLAWLKLAALAAGVIVLRTRLLRDPARADG